MVLQLYIFSTILICHQNLCLHTDTRMYACTPILSLINISHLYKCDIIYFNQAPIDEQFLSTFYHYREHYDIYLCTRAFTHLY